MTLYIQGGTIVNERQTFKGSILIENDCIADITTPDCTPCRHHAKTIDATGCFVLPGIIDEHVHFREPGLTTKADMQSESRAAAYGGVTSFFDMPNTQPQTTTVNALQQKFELGKQNSHINYSFFFGATNRNAQQFGALDTHTVPGIKLFMGASTGNMLVDSAETLEEIFRTSPLPIMTHCEDSETIRQQLAKVQAQFGPDPAIAFHPVIRSAEACYRSTALAVKLAKKHGARLHVAHLTTERELSLFGSDDRITAEAVIAHLIFNEAHYRSLGSRIKCNPAIKTSADQRALQQALTDGRIFTVATDHAPHLLSDKLGGCCTAASGIPMIQFSLPAMLELVDAGVLTIGRMVELMCHHPAQLFEVRERGFLRKGYKADITIVRPNSPWTVTEAEIQSKCKWSPLTGHTFRWRVMQTLCNGHVLYDRGTFDTDYRGQALCFR